MVTIVSPEKYQEQIIEKVTTMLPDTMMQINDRISELLEQGDFQSHSAVNHALAQRDETLRFLNSA